MGGGIAQVVARVGIDVTVLEPTEDLLARGRERVDASTGRAVERGKLDPEEREALVGVEALVEEDAVLPEHRVWRGVELNRDLGHTFGQVFS